MGGALVLVIGGAMLVDGFHTAWRKMVILDCQHQLNQIGLRCRMYAEEHAGRYPVKWADLRFSEDEDAWSRLFRCPYGGHDAGVWSNIDLWADYHLIPGHTTNDPVTQILAVENLADHQGSGANVLHVDGSTQWLPVSMLLTNKAR